jgi:hypothetical protein
MATNYTGNPAASQAPSPNPGFGVAPILSLPDDLDPLNASSIIQALKAVADWSAWLTNTLSPFRGITNWDNAFAGYTVGDVVEDTADHHVYRCILAPPEVGFVPHTNPNYWVRIDWSSADVKQLAGKQTDSTGDITATHGAIVTGASMLAYNEGALKQILFQVSGVPLNGYTDIDLNASATKFGSVFLLGQATDNTAGSDFNRVGLYTSLGGDRNVHRVWYTGSSHTSTTTVGVCLWGS